MKLEEKTRARKILNNLTAQKGLIKCDMTEDLFKSKTLDDFMIACVIKNTMHYRDIPLEFSEKVPFLTRLVKEMPYIIEEIRGADAYIYNKVIREMGDVNDLVGSGLISTRVRKEIASIQEANANSKLKQSANSVVSSTQNSENSKSCRVRDVASNVIKHLNNLI